MEPLAQKLYDAEAENRPAIIAFPEAGERDVLRQLAVMPRWDGNISSKAARGTLCEKGLVARWNGWNFLTQSGYAAADALWGLEKLASKPERDMTRLRQRIAELEEDCVYGRAEGERTGRIAADGESPERYMKHHGDGCKGDNCSCRMGRGYLANCSESPKAAGRMQ